MMMKEFNYSPFFHVEMEKYELRKDFTELRSKLDTHLKALFEGEIDDGNANALDNLITNELAIARNELRNQRKDHQKLIQDVASRRQSDKGLLKAELAARLRELKEIQEERAMYEKRSDVQLFVD